MSRGLPYSHFSVVACQVLWREIAAVASSLPHSYELRFLRQGLHTTPDILRSDLQVAIDLASEGTLVGSAAGESGLTSFAANRIKPKAVLLGYGLCSNGIAGIEARDVPLVAPRAHDCVTFFLGSKERYRAVFDASPGTYWYSPGWIETGTQPGRDHMEKLRSEYSLKYGEDNADYLMEMERSWMQKYESCTYVSLGGFDAVTMEQIAAEADVAKGTLYSHFPIKEAILAYAIHHELGRDLEPLMKQPAPDAGFPAGVAPVMESMARWCEGHRENLAPYLRFRFMDVRVGTPDTGSSGPNDIVDAYAFLIDKSQRAGELRKDIEARHLAELFHHISLAAILRWLSSKNLQLRQELDAAVELFVHGAVAPASTVRKRGGKA